MHASTVSPARRLRRPPTTSIDHENGITGTSSCPGGTPVSPPLMQSRSSLAAFADFYAPDRRGFEDQPVCSDAFREFSILLIRQGVLRFLFCRMQTRLDPFRGWSYHVFVTGRKLAAARGDVSWNRQVVAGFRNSSCLNARK
jgi:hypothetical protein